MKTKNQNGFTALIALVLAAAVIGVAVFAASRVITKEDTAVTEDFGGLTRSAENKIKNSEDLTKTQKSIESVNIDKDLNTSDLDKDIEAIF